MRYTLLLTGLAAVAVAAPMNMAMDNANSKTPSSKLDMNFKDTEMDHASSTNPHPLTMADDAKYIAYVPYAKYGLYHTVIDEVAARMNKMRRKRGNMADDSKYIAYIPYTKYGKYGSTVEEEAAKMDQIRHKRGGVADDNKYAIYVPYSKYGSYDTAIDETAAKLESFTPTKRHSPDIATALAIDSPRPAPDKGSPSQSSSSDKVALPKADIVYGTYRPYVGYGRYDGKGMEGKDEDN